MNVDTPVQVVQFAYPSSFGTYDSCRVTFVDHDQSIVFFGQVANLVHRSHITVHREYSVGDDDTESLSLCFLQAPFEFFHVGIGVAITFGFAKAYTVYDRCMVERIRDDGILFGEQGFEYASVGIETSCIENRVLGMEIAGNRFFELAVQVLRPANEPYRRHAESVGIHRFFRGGDEPGIVG